MTGRFKHVKDIELVGCVRRQATYTLAKRSVILTTHTNVVLPLSYSNKANESKKPT